METRQLTHKIKYLAMHQDDVGNLDLEIFAGSFPALQRVLVWGDSYVTGMWDDNSLIVEPDLSRFREEYIKGSERNATFTKSWQELLKHPYRAAPACSCSS